MERLFDSKQNEWRGIHLLMLVSVSVWFSVHVEEVEIL